VKGKRRRRSSEEKRRKRENSAVRGGNKGKSPKPENLNQKVFQLKFELKKILIIQGSRIYMVCLVYNAIPNNYSSLKTGEYRESPCTTNISLPSLYIWMAQKWVESRDTTGIYFIIACHDSFC
jgi:hypothetical protein